MSDVAEIISARRASSVRVGMILFLASETLFFLALLAAFIVLRSSQPDVFGSHASVTPRASMQIVLALFSFVVVAVTASSYRPTSQLATSLGLSVVILLGLALIALELNAWRELLNRHTIITRFSTDDSSAATTQHATKFVLLAYDGRIGRTSAGQRTFTGPGRGVDSGADIHAIAFRQTRSSYSGYLYLDAEPIDESTVVAEISYGPWKSNFFAWYFLVTGAHILHVAGGLVAIVVLLVQHLRYRLQPASLSIAGAYWGFLAMICFVISAVIWLA